ncbi:MAG: amidohydrolase family protein [Thermodesulfobacteriota bacterium]
MKTRAAVTLVIVWSLLFLLFSCQTPEKPRLRPPASPYPEKGDTGSGKLYIDTHNHLFGGARRNEDYVGAGNSAVAVMDRLGIQRMFIMPPPLSADHPVALDVEELVPAVRKHPGRFAVLGGGGTLNRMIHRSHREGAVTSKLKEQFRGRALDILSKGAIGFGEFAAEHFSFASDHPYESVPADHPLFLELSDIAAEHGVPVDIHMEAVPRDMPLPDRSILTRSGRNPKMLHENISAFERLLAHNRKARIIWAHVGWCNTGFRTPALCRELMAKHPNLYMSFKLSPEGVPEASPISEDRKSIKPEWLELIRAFPDRLVIGTDQFYGPPGARQIGPQKTEATRLLVDLLPPDLARRVGMENAIRLFRL